MARSKAQTSPKARQRAKDERALLRRYHDDIAAIRANYEAQARALGLDDVAADLKAHARARESDYKVLSRHFRHEVSTLRKKGLIGKRVKATTARPTRGLGVALDTFIDVLQGKSKVTKVTPQAAKRLKETGYRVKNNRVVTSPGYKINRKTGALEETKGAFVLETIDLGSNYEAILREQWKFLSSDEYVTFDVYGNFTNQTFGGNEMGLNDLLAKLSQYNPEKVDTVSVLYLPNVTAEEAHIRRFQAEKYDRQEANRRRRKREYRARRKANRLGIRTSRGH